MLRKMLAICIGVVGAVASLNAQTDRKNEIGLLLGGTVTPAVNAASGEAVQIGSGITFQLTYARLLHDLTKLGLYFEIPALAIPLQKITALNGAVPRNYDSFFVTPALRLKFEPQASFSPWLSAGGGYALFDESAERIDGAHNTTRGTSGGVLEFGGGVDIRTPIKVLFPIGLRLEIRDFYTQKPNYNVNTGGSFQHNIAASGGVVLHF